MSARLRPRPLTGRPTVTAVIPCYNYGHYLPTALRSVLEQPGVDIEVIVIDDASPDGSAAVVRRLAAGDKRIRPIIHTENHGHIATYNEGLAQARGDYVALLSADDALTPGSLARAAALFEAHPSVGLVYGHPIVFMDELPQTIGNVRNWTLWQGREWVERLCRTGRNCIMNPEVLLRTSLQHAIGGYDPALPHSGDLAMWLGAAAAMDVGRINGPGQGYYRIHPSSMQRTINAGHVIDLEGRLDAFEKVLVGPEALVRDGHELFAQAKRALAMAAIDCARSACDRGRSAQEPVDDYLAFAARTWPPVRETRRWRAVSRTASGEIRRADGSPGSAARRVVEDVRAKVRWRRWRWTGV